MIEWFSELKIGKDWISGLVGYTFFFKIGRLSGICSSNGQMSSIGSFVLHDIRHPDQDGLSGYTDIGYLDKYIDKGSLLLSPLILTDIRSNTRARYPAIGYLDKYINKGSSLLSP